jgi:signal transduction histidine kinase
MGPVDTLIQIRKLLHELAQPLAATVGLTDLLVLRLDQTSPTYQEIQTLSQQLDRVLQYIDEIRSLARAATPGLEDRGKARRR